VEFYSTGTISIFHYLYSEGFFQELLLESIQARVFSFPRLFRPSPGFEVEEGWSFSDISKFKSRSLTKSLQPEAEERNGVKPVFWKDKRCIFQSEEDPLWQKVANSPLLRSGHRAGAENTGF